MSTGFQPTIRLKRRLRKWHIFFIGIGGVIGVGFVNGASKTLGVAGPGGALMATIIVGLIAIAVMEAICHLICIWPIPNAMVEFVRAFVDDDLGTAIGVLYWYTYCITFSVLVSAIGRFTDYWGEAYLRKTGIYIAVPLILMAINAAPVEVFGWIELIGGILKIMLVLGISLLMFLINIGVGADKTIGTIFIDESIQYNPNVGGSKFVAVSTCLPVAIFAYIGVELLTTTAFEARDPREMRFPARNIGWFTLFIYGLTTGLFAANVSWTDQNLPKLFNQALTMATTQQGVKWKVPNINSEVHVAPLICLLHLGYQFLPGFINGCLIYSAFSCANTALYVASRQLYGLTRTITVDSDSNFFRSFGGFFGRVEHRTQSPWPAILVSGFLLYWLPFLRRANNYEKMDDVQSVLSIAGSVSCILVWCSQCVAYCFFYHWRNKHGHKIAERKKYAALLELENTGWFYVCQPYLSYLAAFATFAMVVFFNTTSMWNGTRLPVKAASAFISPAILLVAYLLKKFMRKRNQWRFWKDLSKWNDFEEQIQYLTDLIFPDDPSDTQSDHELNVGFAPNDAVGLNIQPNHNLFENASHGRLDGNAVDNGRNVQEPRSPLGIDDLIIVPHHPNQLTPRQEQQAHNLTEGRSGSVSPLRPEELMDTGTTNQDPQVYTANQDLDNTSPTRRFYDNRDTLSPRDALNYTQNFNSALRTGLDTNAFTAPLPPVLRPPPPPPPPLHYNFAGTHRPAPPVNRPSYPLTPPPPPARYIAELNSIRSPEQSLHTISPISPPANIAPTVESSRRQHHQVPSRRPIPSRDPAGVSPVPDASVPWEHGGQGHDSRRVRNTYELGESSLPRHGR